VTTIRDTDDNLGNGPRPPLIPRQLPRRVDVGWAPPTHEPLDTGPVRVLQLPDLDLAGLPRITQGRHRRQRLGHVTLITVAAFGLLAIAIALFPRAMTGRATDPLFDAPAHPGVPVARVIGLDGVLPGRAAHRVELPVSNPLAEQVAVTDVQPDPAWSPAGCPASSWRFAVDPADRPTLAPGARVSVVIGVGLTAGAPAGCQAQVLPLPTSISISTPSGRTARLSALGTVTTGQLGSPGLLAEVWDGQVHLTPVPPASGPAPDGYTIDVVGADGRPQQLCRTTGPACTDPTPTPDVAREYRIGADLAGWRTQGAPIRVTPPAPVPRLELPVPASRHLHLRVVASGRAYQVAVLVDGQVVAREQVPAGSPLDADVRLPVLAPGPHRGWAEATGLEQVVGPTLTFTVGSSGSLLPDPARA
jgi:hypothetical protein